MERPWVLPDEIKAYTESPKVKSRAEQALAFDIARAEQYVIFHTHNQFDSDVYQVAIPEDVRMAVVLLAEAYAKQAIIQRDGPVESESFDEYSYTLKSDVDLVGSLGLGIILDAYILTPDNGSLNMKLRKL